MLKYRVWDIIQQKYIDNRDVSITGSGTLTVVGIEGKYHSSVQPPNDLAPRFIIEQYTGLKDKNDVEIYEGDIIECIDKGPEDTEVERDVVSDLTNILSALYRMGELEVIGNIHENSELLDDKDRNVPSKEG